VKGDGRLSIESYEAAFQEIEEITGSKDISTIVSNFIKGKMIFSQSGTMMLFCVPMFEPEVFRKQTYYIGKRTCDIDGTFRRPRSDLAPG